MKNKCNEKEIIFNKCELCKEECIRTRLCDTGRLLYVDVKVNNAICNSKIAIAVIVYDECTIKGFKVREIDFKEYNCEKCSSDCNIESFCFVLPDDELCNERCLKVKVIANYIDIKCNCNKI